MKQRLGFLGIVSGFAVQVLICPPRDWFGRSLRSSLNPVLQSEASF